MILLLTILTITFIISTVVLTILYFRLRKKHKSSLVGIDKDIERAERILNSIVVRLRSK